MAYSGYNYHLDAISEKPENDEFSVMPSQIGSALPASQQQSGVGKVTSGYISSSNQSFNPFMSGGSVSMAPKRNPPSDIHS